MLPRAVQLGLAACAFLVAYVLVVGALAYVNVVMFQRGELDASLYWLLWTIFYLPAAATALLAAWYSGLALRSASALLGAFLALIFAAIEVWLLYDPHLSLFVELVLLTVIFFLVAEICQRASR